VSFNRKQRRAAKSGSAGSSANATEAQLRSAADALTRALPGRGWVLATAPAGADAYDMGNVGQITNMSRAHALAMLGGLMDWYRPRGDVVQPDPSTSAALRHAVDMMRSIPLEEVAANLPNTAAKLSSAVNEKREPKETLGLAMLLASEAITVIDRLMPASAPKLDGVYIPPPPPEPRSWPKGDTKTTLVADLEAKSPSETRDRLIAEAKTGRFHDFDSDELCGKMAALDELRAAGYHDLAQKVIDGAYDDERPTVEQEEEMRQQLGPEFFDAIMGSKPRGEA